MPHRVSFRVLLVVTFFAFNGLSAKGATVDEADHHMEEGEHEEVTINSVSCTACGATLLFCKFGLCYLNREVAD